MFISEGFSPLAVLLGCCFMDLISFCCLIDCSIFPAIQLFFYVLIFYNCSVFYVFAVGCRVFFLGEATAVQW